MSTSNNVDLCAPQVLNVYGSSTRPPPSADISVSTSHDNDSFHDEKSFPHDTSSLYAIGYDSLCSNDEFGDATPVSQQGRDKFSYHQRPPSSLDPRNRGTYVPAGPYFPRQDSKDDTSAVRRRDEHSPSSSSSPSFNGHSGVSNSNQRSSNWCDDAHTSGKNHHNNSSNISNRDRDSSSNFNNKDSYVNARRPSTTSEAVHRLMQDVDKLTSNIVQHTQRRQSNSIAHDSTRKYGNHPDPRSKRRNGNEDVTQSRTARTAALARATIPSSDPLLSPPSSTSSTSSPSLSPSPSFAAPPSPTTTAAAARLPPVVSLHANQQVDFGYINHLSSATRDLTITGTCRLPNQYSHLGNLVGRFELSGPDPRTLHSFGVKVLSPRGDHQQQHQQEQRQQQQQHGLRRFTEIPLLAASASRNDGAIEISVRAHITLRALSFDLSSDIEEFVATAIFSVVHSSSSSTTAAVAVAAAAAAAASSGGAGGMILACVSIPLRARVGFVRLQLPVSICSRGVRADDFRLVKPAVTDVGGDEDRGGGDWRLVPPVFEVDLPVRNAGSIPMEVDAWTSRPDQFALDRSRITIQPHEVVVVRLRLLDPSLLDAPHLRDYYHREQQQQQQQQQHLDTTADGRDSFGVLHLAVLDTAHYAFSILPTSAA